MPSRAALIRMLASVTRRAKRSGRIGESPLPSSGSALGRSAWRAFGLAVSNAPLWRSTISSSRSAARSTSSGGSEQARAVAELEHPRDDRARVGVLGLEDRAVAGRVVHVGGRLDACRRGRSGARSASRRAARARSGRCPPARRAASRCGWRTSGGRSPPGARSRARPSTSRRPCRGCATAGRRGCPGARASSRSNRTARAGRGAGTGRPCASPPRRGRSCSSRRRSSCGGRSPSRSSTAAATARARRPRRSGRARPAGCSAVPSGDGLPHESCWSASRSGSA